MKHFFAKIATSIREKLTVLNFWSFNLVMNRLFAGSSGVILNVARFAAAIRVHN